MLTLAAALSVSWFVYLLWTSVVIVGGAQIAVLERRWFGRPLPEGRVIAMRDEVGIQARILGPGLHLLMPLVYKVQKAPLISIAAHEIGMVEAIDGEPVEPGPIFAQVVDGHNLFQDAEQFLRAGGEKGPQ